MSPLDCDCCDQNGADLKIPKKFTITISKDVSYVAFMRTLEFLYTGLATIADKNDHLVEIMEAASIFECSFLKSYCQNIIDNSEDLNPSIGTYLNDQAGAMAKKLFLNQSLFSDVQFLVQEKLIYAHKAVLYARCPALGNMFTGSFSESNRTTIDIHEISYESFLALLEFLYTSHAPIEESDAMEIIMVSNRFNVSRLITLCELFLSKEVERHTTQNISEAEVDVIEMLLFAQQHNALQLAQFCLHFISTNYLPISKRPEFRKLEGENLNYIETHRWPPVSYLKELEEYENAMKKLNKDGDKCILM